MIDTIVYGATKFYGALDFAPGKKSTALAAAVPLIQLLLALGLIDPDQAQYWNNVVAVLLGGYTLPAKLLR